MFQPCLFNIQNNPFHQFPRIWGLEKIQSSTGNVCVSHSVCEAFSQIFHVVWSRQVELWNRSRWVRWFWAVSVTCRHDPPFVPWWLTRSWGSANLDRSGLGPRLSGQMNLNDGRGLLLASVPIADTLTGQKYRHLGSYGRVWVDSHLVLAYVPCLLPSPLDSIVSGHPERDDVPGLRLPQV